MYNWTYLPYEFCYFPIRLQYYTAGTSTIERDIGALKRKKIEFCTRRKGEFILASLESAVFMKTICFD